MSYNPSRVAVNMIITVQQVSNIEDPTAKLVTLLSCNNDMKYTIARIPENNDQYKMRKLQLLEYLHYYLPLTHATVRLHSILFVLISVPVI